jgi:hypothetical protein
VWEKRSARGPARLKTRQKCRAGFTAPDSGRWNTSCGSPGHIRIYTQQETTMQNSVRPKPDRRKSTLAKASFSPELHREAIARRAYELFCARGGQNGADLDDWLRAEREVMSELTVPSRRATRVSPS